MAESQREMSVRSDAKNWLRNFARPSALAELYAGIDPIDNPHDARMVRDLYFELTSEVMPTA